MEDFNQEGHFARHGGVHFSPNVPAEQINQFVKDLPEHQRDSFYEVLKQLSQEGLITLHNDGLFADGEGNIGGSEEC
ncbi:hypothetical protein GXN76_15855 [Kroppenstedtia pulmonis]|uniref:Uncharacterized protein n=1 Tax=Kroppenstedtia pulmonis TaxID=1380685 RepID=A0A7D3YBQ6_9BACL|nr:hypothetical protein [Kroppenstedtia pulmonis]QKG85781.1 hypothetical protein GXN76_15855 [Kroppenstedtia pulmonis]